MTSFKRDEVTKGFVIKGLHFAVKTACLCVALKKKEKKKGRKEEHSQSVFSSGAALLEQEPSKATLPAASISNPTSYPLL